MKGINLKNIPLAYINLIGGFFAIFAWLASEIHFTGIWQIEKSIFFSGLGILGGWLLGLRLVRKRIEIGATFFTLLGAGISSWILAISPSSFLGSVATIAFGLYLGLLLIINAKWVVKNRKFSWGERLIIPLIGLSLSVFLMFFFNEKIAILKGISVVVFFLAAINFYMIPAQIARFVVVGISRLVFRLKINNLHQIPAHGGALLVSNHVSFLDFVILAGSVPRNIRFVMHQGIFDNRFLKPLLHKLNMIPISPRGGKNNLLKFNERCQQEINAGHVVLIFAEGTVTRNGQTLPFKKGVEYIAKGIDSPIIPINLEGVLGTPLTFTNEHPECIMPTIRNLRQKIIVSIGSPLKPTTSVFVVRQKIIEMGVNSFQQRISRKASLGKWILDIKNKKNLLQDTDGVWWKGSKIKLRSLVIAKRLKKTLRDESKVALLHRNDINFHFFVYALSILGKEIIVLNPENNKGENKRILKKLNTSICINGISKQENPCSGYISAKKVMEKPSFSEKLIARIHLILPSRWVLKAHNNTTGKYNQAVTFATRKEEQLVGTTMTNAMILAASRALHQVHAVADYGCVLSLHSPYNSLGFYLGILLPATLQIPVTKGDFSRANTVIGLVDDLEKAIDKIATNPQISRILMDNEPLSQEILATMNQANIAYFQGFGIRDLAPVIALNIPNFEGKDIVGIPLVQESNNPQTVGRPLPSVAIKIVKENLEELGVNQWGKILIKGASVSKQFAVDQYDNLVNTYLDWVDTNRMGMIDEEGYLVVG